MAAPYKLHGGNSTTRSLRAWNECTKREYAKEGRASKYDLTFRSSSLVRLQMISIRIVSVVPIPSMALCSACGGDTHSMTSAV